MKQDEARAVELYRMAADQDQPDAIQALAQRGLDCATGEQPLRAAGRRCWGTLPPAKPRPELPNGFMSLRSGVGAAVRLRTVEIGAAANRCRLAQTGRAPHQTVHHDDWLHDLPNSPRPRCPRAICSSLMRLPLCWTSGAGAEDGAWKSIGRT